LSGTVSVSLVDLCDAAAANWGYEPLVNHVKLVVSITY
jgi:hypothetical protein